MSSAGDLADVVQFVDDPCDQFRQQVRRWPGEWRGHRPTHHTRRAQIRTQRPDAVVTAVLPARW